MFIDFADGLYSGLTLNQDKARQRRTGLKLIHYIIGCIGDFLNLSPDNRHFLPLKSNIFIFSIDSTLKGVTMPPSD